MKSKVTSTIDYLSDPRKGITAAILLVLVIVAVVFLWSKIKSLWQSSSLKNNLENDQIQTSTGASITLLDSQFAQLAQRLWEATCAPQGAWAWGTNEDEVYAVLNCLNTQADYVKLGNAWTTLYNSKNWWQREMATWGQSRGTLEGILQAELSSSELAHARSILTGKNITPGF